jgi:hypothetical protein
MNRYDVNSSFVQIVDVEASEAREVLSRINPMRSLADPLSALGLDDRAMWSQGTEELSYQLIWRFGADSETAKLVWRLSVQTDGAGRTVLSVRLGGRGSNPAARAKMLSSWTLLEELADGHTRRLARTLDDYVNEDEYEVSRPQLRAVV